AQLWASVEDVSPFLAEAAPDVFLRAALEGVARSQRHPGFSVEILAKLAEIDPGGKLSNRPAASLRNIFRPWIPQTSAPAETRVRTLDALLQRHRDVTWSLLLALLSEDHEVGRRTHRPRFRDWVAEDQPTLTHEDIPTVVDSVAERVVRITT